MRNTVRLNGSNMCKNGAQLTRQGNFVRLSYDEVSVSHPDAIRKILLAPLNKVGMESLLSKSANKLIYDVAKSSWYKIFQLPDYRFQAPMAITDPKKKIEKSKHIAPAYTLSQLIRQEEHISDAIEPLLGWLDSYAADQKPMDLDQFLSYTAFDVVGEFAFSKRFDFLKHGHDIGNSIKNAVVLNAYV